MSEYRKLGRLFACAAALLLIGALYACIEPEEAIGSATDLLKYCGVNELEGVADLRRISDDCKEALRDLLPDYEDNLAHALVPLGSGIFDDRTVLFFTAADGDRNPLTSSDETELRVSVLTSTTETVLDTAQFALGKLKDYSGLNIALSAVVDYSGSMSDQDLDDAAEIYTDLFNGLELTSRFEANLLFFSDEVHQIVTFTEDATALRQGLRSNIDFERAGTALYDGIGTGLDMLSARDTPIRLLLVASDGFENHSQIYTKKSQLYELARQQRIPLIMLGALLSDVPSLRAMAKESNGLFIYSPYFLELKQDFLRLRDLLMESAALELRERQAEWESVRIEIKGKQIEWPLP
ncbi:MAG: VWA domain-containing protein [Gemmatimonadetes bacterium]|jgi:hypothetical protein|nr:VWA domain-containing protein [Gemmatimonadota bacterium]MBT5329750.1 VWA domain-containing protein [Gemmatimonadota bacterium]MBT5451339.1 VWA domain-containing protein [Gemmatimonadota bacterium]MBT6620005.1 VWA domain-containing protein [Gemmatimonadota bacterium]MBT6905154.1 VWA domain-containing protein [Gemmatimonadota bacterium]